MRRPDGAPEPDGAKEAGERERLSGQEYRIVIYRYHLSCLNHSYLMQSLPIAIHSNDLSS
jgi:hypothetical protein